MPIQFFLRKSSPNINGLIRCLHMITSVEKLYVPKMNEHLTIPKGARLLPVADHTFVLHKALKSGRFNCL